MEKKIFNINVPKVSHGKRLDKFLQSELVESSRTRLKNLIIENINVSPSRTANAIFCHNTS